MRKEIDIVQKLFEMPYLSTSRLDFGLETVEGNQKRLNELKTLDPSLVWARGEDSLWTVGNTDAGYYFLVYEGDEAPIIHYLVKYERQQLEALGAFVTQVQLWRATDMHYRAPITDEVFFDILLPAHGTIVSDEAQTLDGRNFWLRQMAKASLDGFLIGSVDENGNISSCAEYKNLRQWRALPQQQNAWGETLVHMQRRFFITSK